MAGLIVFLNGTSSSGKSSIARELLAMLPEPWFHLPGDAFHFMRNRPDLAADSAELAEMLRRTRAGYHRAVAGMAAAGNNVVMDHVLAEPWRLADCLGALPGAGRRTGRRALPDRGAATAGAGPR